MSVESKPETRPAAKRSGGSLRERKKERTRQAIRVEAFRLFREQGYAATTVEQIAEAAEVSPSTFFRYFPSKEQVVLVDDLDPIIVARYREQPPELSALEAIKRTMLEAIDGLDPSQFEFERERADLVRSVPELRGALAREMDRNVDLIAGMVAERVGREAGDIEVRALAGAFIGAAEAVLMDPARDPFDLTAVAGIIDFLSAGMPL
ncbi:TetR family transcriptional regulator [Nocardia otitidiscaviarum]|uniref:acyl-CoA-like ligand-binding transcription factor n=1 Tax=Nocardia otitidiscaviarum TaxID=1823 RepID=UPI0004A7778C|nr:TetR family transcriptional regulator [Nocardia otitidiscaviarum]MBF6133662.1 TetR family transcriptional regulator [Nocardia otitidiscaviarum]MBF6487690.1 TetR family transcriptional regulator [Nocardia otitidiscaviarum]